MSSRRDFLKKFACAACFCGFGNLISLASETNEQLPCSEATRRASIRSNTEVV